MVANKQCAYRKQAYDCTHPTIKTIEGQAGRVCPLCLAGQHIDAIELQTSAIANLTASMEEAIITSLRDGDIIRVANELTRKDENKGAFLIDFMSKDASLIKRKNLDDNGFIKSTPSLNQAIIAKCNIIEGIEAKE